ncbi:MAG TPA: DUF2235 domain-containing protein [Bradyrhizobium sp.]|nr:DUF2235 domain-containing protein [Bradyrhizobium sp.]
MAGKIIILSDGTGNAASSVWRTNVWRMFQSLDLQENYQAAKYDDGVGTSSFLPLALLGGAFGWGLKRNILDAYKFISRNYESATKGAKADSLIYLFGFSRGAFTVRVLAAFILEQGLIKANSESELHDLARKAYRAYRAKGYHSIWRLEVPFRALRDALVRLADRLLRRPTYDQRKNIRVPTIEFIGVWDTVAAYGLPIDEMTRGISNWIWPLELPNRVLDPRVKCVRHAIALDDERTTFHPVLWTEQPPGDPLPPVPATIDGERLVQVWFVGMHSNVGGGYPDDAVAFVPLYWLLKEAKGLDFKIQPAADPDTYKWIATGRDKDGRLYDSRAGLGSYYRYGPRKVFELCNDSYNRVSVRVPKIHESVFERIDSGCNAYAPIGLPEVYTVVKDSGTVLPPGGNPFETLAQAKARVQAQERLWNFAWLRRLTYFATLAATLHLVAFWLFHDQNPLHEFDSRFRMVSESVRLVESFLPHSLHWWTDWYAGNPEWFAGGIIVLVLLSSLGSSLSASIKDGMRVVWLSHGITDPVPHSLFQKLVFAVRTNRFYRWFINFGRLQFAPFVLAFGLVWLVLSGASHFFFNVADSMGAFCQGTPPKELVAAKTEPQELNRQFTTASLCAPTGVTVEAGQHYEIRLTVTSPWLDTDISTTPIGYRTAEVELPRRLLFYAGIPLRRILFRPWFRLIARRRNRRR